MSTWPHLASFAPRWNQTRCSFSALFYLARFLGGLELEATPTALWAIAIVYVVLVIIDSFVLDLAPLNPSGAGLDHGDTCS
ncbi:MAG: hypothetical protein ABIS84_05505 [Arachnia sp.]